MDIEFLKNRTTNFNKGRRFMNLLVNSIKKLGCARSIVVDNNYNVICGDKTLQAAKEAGVKKIIVIETSGNELVVVKRKDVVPMSNKALEISLVDNLATDKNLIFDTDILLDTIEHNISFNPQFWGAHEHLVKDLDIEMLLKQNVEKIACVKNKPTQELDYSQLSLF
jgi:hypothetical protein